MMTQGRNASQSWPLTGQRVQAHLVILTAVLWTVLAIDWVTPTRLMRTGQIKGTDFVHFYTLAKLAAEGRIGEFADLGTQRAMQLTAIPESVNDWFPPVYGPLVALMLTPLGWMSYGVALTVWLALTGVMYLVGINTLARRTVILRRYPRQVLLAAIANPAFWNLIVHGQLSIVGLLSVVLTYIFLSARQELLSGVAIGLLAYKPSLLAPALVILCLARSWRIVAGVVVSATVQGVLTIAVVGPDGINEYGRIIANAPALAALLAAKPEQMHSWRAFWLLLLPNVPAILFYAASAGLTAILAANVWRRSASVQLRMSALLLAVILAAPHLYVYDLVLLSPAWIWMTEWFLSESPPRPRVAQMLYLGFVAPLFTVITRITHVQISVICFMALVWFLSQSTERATERISHADA